MWHSIISTHKGGPLDPLFKRVNKRSLFGLDSFEREKQASLLAWDETVLLQSPDYLLNTSSRGTKCRP